MENTFRVGSRHQESRIEKTDLMDALDCCWALAHIDPSVVPSDKIDNMRNKYQIGYKDEGKRRTYGVSLTGLSKFANDFRYHYKSWQMKTDKLSIKSDIMKVSIVLDAESDIAYKWKKPGNVVYFPGLDNSIGAYTFTVEGDNLIGVLEARAMQLLLTINDFLEAYKRDFKQ